MNILYAVVYDAIYTLILAFTAMFLCKGNYFDNAPTAANILLTAAVSAAVLFFYYVGKKGKEVFTAVFIAVIFGLWLFRNSENMPSLSIYTMKVIPIVITVIACFILIHMTVKKLFVRFIAAVCMSAYVIFSMIGKKEISSPGTSLILLFILMTSIEIIQSRLDKKGYTEGRAHLVAVVPFTLVIFAVMLLLPKPAEPFDWKFAKKAYVTVREYMITVSQHIIRHDSEDFIPAYTGFSDSGEIASGVIPSESEVMTVGNITDQPVTLYLSGKIYDTFDGRRWEQKYTGDDEDRLLDTIETVSNIKMKTGTEYNDYIKPVMFRVTYRYFSSSYLFAPLKTFRFSDCNKELKIYRDGGNILSKSKLSYGDSYIVNNMVMNSSNSSFSELFKMKGTDEDDSVCVNTALQLSDGRYGNDIETELSEHEAKIKEIYLHDIHLSDESRKYIASVTSGAETDYDKLKCIEKALSKMKYDTAPGALPAKVRDGASFTDYFLSDSRKGFCAYYATVFVMIANSEGIPARYVQGYTLHVKRNETAQVTSDMAHAWPEAYIDGFGWMVFEPTPGYERYTDTGWATDSDRGTESAEIPAVIPEPEHSDTELSVNSVMGKKIRYRLPAAVAGTVIIILILCLTFDRALSKYRFRKMRTENKFLYQYARNNKILSWIGLRRDETETLSEFCRKCSRTLPGNHTDYIKTYEEYIFGNRKIAEEDFINAEAEEDKIIKEARLTGKRRYIILRIWMYVTRL